MKIKNFCSWKDAIIKMKRWARLRINIFLKIYLIQEFYSENKENAYNWIMKRSSAPLKNGQMIWAYTSPKKMCKWQKAHENMLNICSH